MASSSVPQLCADSLCKLGRLKNVLKSDWPHHLMLMISAQCCRSCTPALPRSKIPVTEISSGTGGPGALCDKVAG